MNNWISPTVKHVWNIAMHVLCNFFRLSKKTTAYHFGQFSIHLLLPIKELHDLPIMDLKGIIGVKIFNGFVPDFTASSTRSPSPSWGLSSSCSTSGSRPWASRRSSTGSWCWRFSSRPWWPCHSSFQSSTILRVLSIIASEDSRSTSTPSIRIQSLQVSVTIFFSKFVTLANFFKSLAIFWQFIAYLAKCWTYFGKFVILLG